MGNIDHNTLVYVQIVGAVITSLIASSGFWLFLDRARTKRGLDRRLLIGLAHDRIVFLCLKYIRRGFITQDEYENLCEFLYNPYIELGANGSAGRLMAEINRLPIKVIPLPTVAEQDVKGEKDASS